MDDSGDVAPTEAVKLVPDAVEERYTPGSTGAEVNPIFFGWSLVSRSSIGFNDSCGADPGA
jgi:hypothetical protein